MYKLLLVLITVCYLICSCGEDKTPKTASNKTEKSSGKIRNGIEIKSKGIRISQAFLLFDDGSLVPASNEAKVNQTVNLRLLIESGLKEENGKVNLGVSEKIETNTGEVILDEPDLFGTNGEMETVRASVITLKAVITRIEKLYDYFVVSFRLWDKKSNAEVTGSYKLYII